MAIDSGPALLERQAELAELDDALRRARQGAGGVVVIEAPAGLGKTSLLRATLAAAAETGLTCLRARASELERDFAYGCVRQLFEPAVAKATGDRRERLFDGAAILAQPLFAPRGTVADPPAGDSASSMLHGLYWLVDNLAEEAPLLLCIDDLHWSDAESLRFLGYLAPRIDGLPVAVVATSRPDAGNTVELARLAAAPEVSTIRPRPLSTAAIATLCEHRLPRAPAAAFAEACRAATGGNPFFVDALLREATERRLAGSAAEAAGVQRLGPTAVAHAVLLRLSGAPPATTAVVRAMAVLGDGASVAEVARLAGVPEQEAAQAADLLLSLGILAPSRELEFAHPIVRESVYADMGPRERARAHAEAATTLAQMGAADERVAAQIVPAEPAGDGSRVELLRRVAADALARGAPAAAVALLTRALAEPPAEEAATDVLLTLGLAEQRIGAPDAADHVSAAVAAIREPSPLATAVRLLANALSVSGEADRAVEALATAIDAIEPHDRELALLLEAELASHALQASPDVATTARTRLERRGELGGSTPRERLVLASLAFQRSRAQESAGEAAETLESVLVGGLLDEQGLDIVGPFYDVVVGLLATDALDVVEAHTARALDEARARGSIPATAFLTGRRGRLALRRGDVILAESDGRTAVTLLRTHGIPLGLPFATALLVDALVEGGQLEEAEQAQRDSGLGADLRPGPTNNFLLGARAAVLSASGRPREAYADLVELGRRDELWGAANPLASRWRSCAALALVAAGDLDRARDLAAEDLERARRWGAASGVGLALRAVALSAGDSAPSIETLQESAAVLEPSVARLEHARTLTDLGAALRRANRRAEARTALEPALELAERLGGRAVADRARTELLAAGGRSSNPFGTGVEQLTASERRVAELAAEGRSNPSIAQELFVTRKTVETHLSRIYRKLDIAGRGELRGALLAGDGVPGS